MAAEGPFGTDGPVIIAWDTCTVRGVIAVGAGAHLLAETRFEASKGHTTWLLPQLDEMMSGLGLASRDVGFVAAGIGPGTFTGVKVSVACAKAVSLGVGRPAIGISTLDVLAWGAPEDSDLVLAVTDARRGQLYAAAYRRTGGGMTRETGYLCENPHAIIQIVNRLRFRKLALTGEAPRALTREFERRDRVQTSGEVYPTGGALLALAASRASSGETCDPASLSPIYLKKPV